MNDEVIRLTADDFEETMDFINMVFSMSGRPHHFQSLLPKLYQPDDEKMRAHFAIRRQGRLRAVVGLYPMSLHIGSAVVKAGGIGAVSTHPEERKSGLMRRLMQAIVDEMATEGYAISALGGQRQRYGYYGYEQSGSKLTFDLNKTNLRHFFQERTFAAIRFEKLDLANAPLHDSLPTLKRWHDSQPIHVERPLETFAAVLSSWYADTWLARDGGGDPIGYLVSNREGNAVSELIAVRPERLLSLAAAWVDQQTDASVQFTLAPWQQDAIADLGRIAEHCRIQPAYAFKIIDWPQMLAALLKVRSGLQTLPDGQIRLGIEDQGQVRVFELSWLDGQATCRLCARDMADLVLDHLTATRLLFGPLAPAMVIPQHMPANQEHNRLLSLWLPLPLYWPSPDNV